MYSPSIDKLISTLKNLPSVGQHTAERYVFYWLKSGKKEVNEILGAIKNLMESVKSCENCWNFSDTNPCPLCQDKTRDQNILCVVADPTAIPVLEKSGEYNGQYHVLRGTLDTTDLDSIGNLKITDLFQKIKKQTNITEIILALNPDMRGETTAMYLEKEIKKNSPTIKISRLARGLPMGSDLQYADEITLSSAFKHRY